MAATFYDWIERKEKPRRNRPLQARENRRQERRRRVMSDLLIEIENGGVTALYANLLVHEFISTDETLMEEFGEEFVELTDADQQYSSSKRIARRVR